MPSVLLTIALLSASVERVVILLFSGVVLWLRCGEADLESSDLGINKVKSVVGESGLIEDIEKDGEIE